MHCVVCSAELVERDIEGRTRHVCPSCGRIAYAQPTVGAGVLVERDGRLLLSKRGPASDAFPGTWNLPAGFCEADESPPLTAAREAFEETGLLVHVERLREVYYFDDDPRGSGLLIVYEAVLDRDYADAAPVPRPGEATEVAFFAPGDLPEPLCSAGHDRAIRAWEARALDRWVPGSLPRSCPHCAHPLAEREAFGRKRLTCPACGYIHFRELKVGVSLVIERDGQILLIRRAEEPGRGLWALPSGFVEWDEPPERAVCRECAEETGLTAGSPALIGVTHYDDDFRGPGINLIYRVEASGSLQAGDDAAEVRFFAPADLPLREEIAFAGHADLLESLRAPSASTPGVSP